MQAEDRQPPIDYLERITAQYRALGYSEYRWRRAESPPIMTALAKPLSDCRVGLIATGGIYAEGQTAFTHKDDTSYRAIPAATPTAQLRASHFAYDLTDARRDIGVVFPVVALRELADDGIIGELAPHLLTCMGGIYSQRRARDELVPALVDRCLTDDVDVVLLVPV